MKKLFALLCSLMVLAGAAFTYTGTVSVRAQYTQAELEGAISSAVDWTRKNNNPLDDIGADAADIAATAFKRAGIDYDYHAYLDGLDPIAEKYTNSDPIASMQLSLMAVSALGGDTKYFGGRDLAGDSTYYRWLDSVEDYSGALIALNAGGIDIPADTGIDSTYFIRNILSYQREDGSFGSVRETAGAIIALSDYYNSTEYAVTYADGREGTSVTCKQAIDNAMSWLSAQQSNEGDFYSLTDTAMVSLAMDSLGVGQTDERFVKEDNTVIDGLLTYQTTDGGFSEDYNDTDELATAYALSAMVSNARALQNKAEYFDFKSDDTITLSGSGTATSPRATSAPRTTARVTAAPRATKRPTTTAKPRATSKPRSSAKSSASPSASGAPKLTPSPTKRPDLVGPAQIIGPIPMNTPQPPELDNDEDEISRDNTVVPIIIGIIGLLAAAAAVLIIVAKRKLRIFKKTKNIPEIYHAKRHRRTEEHRGYEKRRKFEWRGKYKK